ncbi:hypothetical protein MHYP_G00191700 [Metynnis hypsauchen]
MKYHYIGHSRLHCWGQRGRLGWAPGQRAHKEHEPVCSPLLMPRRKESQLSAPNEINCLQKLTLRREEGEREGEFKWEFNS